MAQPILFKLSESTCLLLYYYIIQLGNGYNCRLTDRNFEKLMNIKCNAHFAETLTLFNFKSKGFIHVHVPSRKSNCTIIQLQ